MQATRQAESPRQTGCLCFGKGKPAPKTAQSTNSIAVDTMKQLPASPGGKWASDGNFYPGGINVPPASPLAPTQWKEMPAKPDGSK